MKIRKWLAGAAVAAALPGAASAGMVTLDGAYFDVTYDDALVGLFGTPTIVGDAIKWFPSGSPGFTAKVTAGDNLVVTNSTFAMSIKADAGYQLTGADLWEAGDYFHFSDGLSGVSVSGQLRVAGTPSVAITPTAAFTENAVLDFSTIDWSATASQSLAAPASQANISIQNILAAWAANGAPLQAAFIEKKEVVLSVGVAPIPEPATWAMMATGAILLGFGLRRNRG
ncbi:MAG: PEP-CTERM sorting domain-containing protein [Burkholderiales bacterium]